MSAFTSTLDRPIFDALAYDQFGEPIDPEDALIDDDRPADLAGQAATEPVTGLDRWIEPEDLSDGQFDDSDRDDC